jgi:alanine racemase
MSRLGCRPAEALDLARSVAITDGIQLEGLFTHLARADEPDVVITAEQLAAFAEVVGELTAAGLRPPLVHTANSAGIFTVASPLWRSGALSGSSTLPEAGYDLVRLGIAMYGLSPGPQVRLPDAVRPALTWKSVLSQVKQVPPGQGLSYGHTYTTSRLERIGTVPVGYADGWRRTAGNEVLVGGRRVPVVGRVCMDQCLVNLDDVPHAAAGDEVVLIGAQGGERITADDVAARWGTIGYEVVCGIGSRVPRLTELRP